MLWLTAAVIAATDTAGAAELDDWALMLSLLLHAGTATALVAAVVMVGVPLEQLATISYRSGYADGVHDGRLGVSREGDVVELPLTGGPAG